MAAHTPPALALDLAPILPSPRKRARAETRPRASHGATAVHRRALGHRVAAALGRPPLNWTAARRRFSAAELLRVATLAGNAERTRSVLAWAGPARRDRVNTVLLAVKNNQGATLQLCLASVTLHPFQFCRLIRIAVTMVHGRALAVLLDANERGNRLALRVTESLLCAHALPEEATERADAPAPAGQARGPHVPPTDEFIICSVADVCKLALKTGAPDVCQVLRRLLALVPDAAAAAYKIFRNAVTSANAMVLAMFVAKPTTTVGSESDSGSDSSSGSAAPATLCMRLSPDRTVAVKLSAVRIQRLQPRLRELFLFGRASTFAHVTRLLMRTVMGFPSSQCLVALLKFSAAAPDAITVLPGLLNDACGIAEGAVAMARRTGRRDLTPVIACCLRHERWQLLDAFLPHASASCKCSVNFRRAVSQSLSLEVASSEWLDKECDWGHAHLIFPDLTVKARDFVANVLWRVRRNSSCALEGLASAVARTALMNCCVPRFSLAVAQMSDAAVRRFGKKRALMWLAHMVLAEALEPTRARQLADVTDMFRYLWRRVASRASAATFITAFLQTSWLRPHGNGALATCHCHYLTVPEMQAPRRTVLVVDMDSADAGTGAGAWCSSGAWEGSMQPVRVQHAAVERGLAAVARLCRRLFARDELLAGIAAQARHHVRCPFVSVLLREVQSVSD